MIRKTTHADEMVANFTSKLADKPNLAKLMRVLGTQVQALEDALWKVYDAEDIDLAKGYQLDKHGARVQQPRNGQLDAAYRVSIKARRALLASTGTLNEMILALNARIDQAFPKTLYIYPNTLPIPNLVAYKALANLVRPAAVELGFVENSDVTPLFRLDSADPNGLDSGKLSRRV